jgi:hypothetical protein
MEPRDSVDVASGQAPQQVPGETRARRARQLDRAPSERYGERDPGTTAARGAATTNASRGPLLRAGVAGLAGAGLLILVGGVLASTSGLLFVSGATGAAIGLLLARAALAGPDTPAPMSRTAVIRIAALLALAAVGLGGLGTWVLARAEGGALGPLDYLLTTFGLFVPGELIVAAVAAVWGASAGPVQAS